MSKFDTSTPQLKLAQQWSDAYTSLDIKNVESIISEDFQYLIFPDSTDSPQEPKEKHMERLGMMMTVLSKVEVRIDHRRTSFRLRNLIYLSPRPLTTK